MAAPAKKPIIDALRSTIESLERDYNYPTDDPALAKLKENLVLRIVQRDESPLPTLDDLNPHSNDGVQELKKGDPHGDAPQAAP